MFFIYVGLVDSEKYNVLLSLIVVRNVRAAWAWLDSSIWGNLYSSVRRIRCGSPQHCDDAPNNQRRELKLPIMMGTVEWHF